MVGERGAVGPEAQPDGERDLELLYRDAGPQLWRAIYGFAGGRRHLAEDAVAEAFARALERRQIARIRLFLGWCSTSACPSASSTGGT